MVDYIADYLENIRDRRVFPDVTPGYMRKMISDEVPQEGESFSEIFKDVERVIMPGVSLSIVQGCGVFTHVFLFLFSGHSLAKPLHARLFPGSKQLSLTSWRHAGKWD